LVWNKQIKKITVIQNIQKLQICCVVEDDKVMLDNVFEPIEEWEEVQSVDLVMMQKV
jgi:translation elongation factor EF-1beta